MRHCLSALLLTLALPMAHAEDPQLRLARYSSVATSPVLADYSPLETIATLNFPAQVDSVGEALHFTLLRTGYSIGHTDADATHLMALPLPLTHRGIGPARVTDLLAILVGPSYAVEANSVDRTISIARASAAQPHTTAAHTAKASSVEVVPEAEAVPAVVVPADTPQESTLTSLPASVLRQEMLGP